MIDREGKRMRGTQLCLLHPPPNVHRLPCATAFSISSRPHRLRDTLSDNSTLYHCTFVVWPTYRQASEGTRSGRHPRPRPSGDLGLARVLAGPCNQYALGVEKKKKKL